MTGGRPPRGTTPAPFRDRRHAGAVLAAELGRFAGRAGLLVLALPRGGVPVAYEVATALGAPLDVLPVRKLGVPGHEELALGALAEGGALVRNEAVVDALDIDEAAVEAVLRRERAELERRRRRYRGDAPPADVAGRCVILVDDGLATGATMAAAVAAVRGRGPASVVVAAPVAAAETCEALRRVADDVVCAATPDRFQAVGAWYRDFSETGDEEVRDLLRRVPSPAAAR